MGPLGLGAPKQYEWRRAGGGRGGMGPLGLGAPSIAHPLLLHLLAVVFSLKKIAKRPSH